MNAAVEELHETPLPYQHHLTALPSKRDNTPARTSKRLHIAQAIRFAHVAFELLTDFKAQHDALKAGLPYPPNRPKEAGKETSESPEEPYVAGKIEAVTLYSLTRAWDTSLERLRILQQKPLPGSRRPAPDPIKAAAKRKPANTMSEIIPERPEA